MKDFVVNIKNKIVNTIVNHKSDIKAFVFGFIISIILVFGYHTVIIKGKAVGISNNPTINEGEYIYSLKYCYCLDRNDIVIANPKKLDWLAKNEDIVKRIVAVEGDHVVIKDGNLYINGVQDNMVPGYQYKDDVDIVIPDDCYYLLGDNRANSYDSRKFGVVHKDEIAGKVIWHGKRLVDKIKGN